MQYNSIIHLYYLINLESSFLEISHFQINEENNNYEFNFFLYVSFILLLIITLWLSIL